MKPYRGVSAITIYVDPCAARREILITEETAMILCRIKDGNVARLFLLLCGVGNKCSKDELCKTLAITTEELEKALNSLMELNLVSGVAQSLSGKGEDENSKVEKHQDPQMENDSNVFSSIKSEQEIQTQNTKTVDDIEKVSNENRASEMEKALSTSPKYTKEEIVTLSRSDRAFAQIVKEAEKTIKPMLTESDLRELMTIYGYFGLPADCVIMLLHFVSARTKAQTEGAKRASMLTVKREAYKWLDKGIITVELADKYISEEVRVQEVSFKIEALLGQDVYSNDERRLIKSWVELGYCEKTVTIAKEISETRLGEINLRYIGTIIKNWKKNKLNTAEEILQDEREKAASTTTSRNVKKRKPARKLAGADRELDEAELESFFEIQRRKDQSEI